MVNGKILSWFGACSRFLIVFFCGMLSGIGVASASELPDNCKMVKDYDKDPSSIDWQKIISGSKKPVVAGEECFSGKSTAFINCYKKGEITDNGDGTFNATFDVYRYKRKSDGVTVDWGNADFEAGGFGGVYNYPLIDRMKCEAIEPDLSDWKSCKVGKFSWTSIVGGAGGDYREDNYSCDDPELLISIPRIGDGGGSNLPDDEQPERACTGDACEDSGLVKANPDDIPCFGGQCSPDYEQGEQYQGKYPDQNGKMVPCFAKTPESCQTLAPDYVSTNGTPCWGDFCNATGKAPIYSSEQGKICVGGYCEGAAGINKWGDKIENGEVIGRGSSGGGVSGGSNSSGSGSTGEGEGDGWGGVGNLPSTGMDGFSALDIPKSFWERKYEGKDLEDVFRSSGINDALPSLSGMNLNIGAGVCPVFQFEYFGDVSPPCWIWDWIRAFFLAVCSFAAFTIIFRR